MNGRSNAPASFLLADCGSTTTTVALFDRVGDAYRVIARGVSPSTTKAPWRDVLVGVQEAIRQISTVTGRSLLTEDGDLITPEQQNGSGVDYFGVTISAARPLKVIVAGLLEDVSVASARRALQSIYAEEVTTFTLDTPRSEQEQIQSVLDQRPDVVFIAGGADGSDPQQLLQLLESLELGVGLLDGARRPDVLYGGNSKLREHVTETFSSSATVYVAENVRPTIDVERLNDAKQTLGDIYLERTITDVPGIQGLAAWANLSLQTSGRAFGTMIDYFGALYRSQVLGIDLGSNSICLAAANNDEPGRLFLHSRLGLGEPLPEILNLVEPEAILQWVAGDCDERRLKDFIFDKAIHPHSVPLTEEEAYVEQAVARVLLQQTFHRAAHSWGWSTDDPVMPAVSLIVVRGNALTVSARPGMALLTILDALQPTGVFPVALDRGGILPMLGLLAADEPAAVVQILEGGVLYELGWVIAPLGAGEPGQHALHISVVSEQKGEYHIDAEYGELITVPLGPGESAELTLKPEKKVDVGRGPGRSRKITVHGGAVGLVVDVRGRPLSLPTDDDERRNRVRQWHWDMGG